MVIDTARQRLAFNPHPLKCELDIRTDYLDFSAKLANCRRPAPHCPFVYEIHRLIKFVHITGLAGSHEIGRSISSGAFLLSQFLDHVKARHDSLCGRREPSSTGPVALQVWE